MRTRSTSTSPLCALCALSSLVACAPAADTQTNFATRTSSQETTSGGAQIRGGGEVTTSSTTTTGTQVTGPGDSQPVGLAAASGSNPTGSVATGPALGGDADHPVPRCGARDSYYFVSTEFRCPDGSNPLGGNLALGQRSRRGNVGANNTTGNIIDLYEVPCATGPQRVYVDMYHCPPGVNPLFGP